MRAFRWAVLNVPNPTNVIGCPFFNDFVMPSKKDSTAAVAFVFVMPEYNQGYNAPLKNALDYLYTEWHDKPVGFVSYGGIAAGTRAVQMTKQIVSALKMLPVYEAVYIPFVASRIEDGRFNPSDVTEEAAGALLDELVRVEAGLHTLRAAPAVQA